MKNLIITAIFLTGSAIADDLTIPNTFKAGTPARAAEVNDNFTAVEASVDDNAQDIAANTLQIGNVSTGVSTNTQGIGMVAQSVAALAGPTSYKFVGFSTALVDGTVGFFGMNAACQADFGPDARWATSQNIIDSTIQPTLATSGAWVQPVIIAIAPASTSWFFDVSGVRVASVTHSVNCTSWSVANAWGFLE